MTENQDFYTDGKQAFDVPAAAQEEIAAAEETTPVGAPEKKKRPRWEKLLCCLLCAAFLVGGGKILWETYPMWDTNPNAPFMDLSCWTKKKIITTVSDYWSYISWEAFWYGDSNVPSDKRYRYGLQYYGTFGGYHFVLSSLPTVTGEYYKIYTFGNYSFDYNGQFWLFAYKDGQVIPLEELYENGVLTDAQIAALYHCYRKYRQQVYSQ